MVACPVRKCWVLSMDGREHTVEVEWDLVLTSRGNARVDGIVVATWWSKVKFPGVTERVHFAGHDLAFRQTFGSFDLDLRRAPEVTVVHGLPATAGGSLVPWVLGIACLLAVLGALLAVTVSRMP
ncbi:MAG: hypothetical protein ABTD50_00640 [Polyangiaceae bacterium]